MSIHSSLRLSSAGGGQRNVWSRVERITALRKAGRWNDGDAVEGLPKVRTRFKAKGKRAKKDDAAEDGKKDAKKDAAKKDVKKK